MRSEGQRIAEVTAQFVFGQGQGTARARSAGIQEQWVGALVAGIGSDIAGKTAGVDDRTRNALFSHLRILCHPKPLPAGRTPLVVAMCALRVEQFTRQSGAVDPLAKVIAAALAREKVTFAVVGTRIRTDPFRQALASDEVVSPSITGFARRTGIARRTETRARSPLAVPVCLGRAVVLAVPVAGTNHSRASTQSIVGGQIDCGQGMGLVSGIDEGLRRNVWVSQLSDEATFVWAEWRVGILGPEDAIGVGAGGNEKEHTEQKPFSLCHRIG